jgi:hypothetical protein
MLAEQDASGVAAHVGSDGGDEEGDDPVRSETGQVVPIALKVL